MRIIIAGASGFIGKYLTDNFTNNGNTVVQISRSSDSYNWKLENLILAVNGADVLINLAGRSINCRQNSKNKTDILNSRIVSTHLLNDAVRACVSPPKLWINASAIGIYAHQTAEPHTENSNQLAADFFSHVVQSWENAFFNTQNPAIRKIALRFSVVLGKNGGALQPLKLLAKFGFGGKLGSGTQMFSWIHISDLFSIVNFIIKNDTINGIINCTAPQPVSNADLMKEIRKNTGKKIGMPVPAFLIKIGALVFGADSKLVLESNNVIPNRLKEYGFIFRFDNINVALENLL